MGKRNKHPTDVLETIAELAKILDSHEFLDKTSPAARRLIRSFADLLGKAFVDAGLEVTATNILSFYMGAAAQATTAISSNPISEIITKLTQSANESTVPNMGLVISVAYLARDVLAGERVE